MTGDGQGLINPNLTYVGFCTTVLVYLENLILFYESNMVIKYLKNKVFKSNCPFPGHLRPLLDNVRADSAFTGIESFASVCSNPAPPPPQSALEG
jgi:hypothetical protein